jgi:dTDP-4-dehydrorhamnose 3,5-epimerase
MRFTKLAIPDVVLVESPVLEDGRGFFLESYHKQQFLAAGLKDEFVQDNHSRSRQGSLRGLHYQIRQPQGKLVRVVVGEAYDVAVDLRRRSPTFGRWLGVHLSSDTKSQVWIPPGFAHGFYVLSDWAEVLYKTTDYYAPEWERTLVWNDPTLQIGWPLLAAQPTPLLSEKDAAGRLFLEAETYP